MGMGGVALKDKAISYLKSAGLNKNSEEVSALKVEMEALREAVTKRDAQIEKLMEQLTEPEDEPRRKRKAA
jgi:predicted ATP-grasp superfamily ATP-dependent carboligase